jgi:hypothetical protein
MRTATRILAHQTTYSSALPSIHNFMHQHTHTSYLLFTYPSTHKRLYNRSPIIASRQSTTHFNTFTFATSARTHTKTQTHAFFSLNSTVLTVSVCVCVCVCIQGIPGLCSSMHNNVRVCRACCMPPSNAHCLHASAVNHGERMTNAANTS